MTQDRTKPEVIDDPVKNDLVQAVNPKDSVANGPAKQPDVWYYVRRGVCAKLFIRRIEMP